MHSTPCVTLIESALQHASLALSEATAAIMTVRPPARSSFGHGGAYGVACERAAVLLVRKLSQIAIANAFSRGLGVSLLSSG